MPGYETDPDFDKVKKPELEPIQVNLLVQDLNQEILPELESSQDETPDPGQKDDAVISQETTGEKEKTTVQEKTPEKPDDSSAITYKKLRNRNIPLDPK